MASVESLGLHQPSGLQYAINEQLLPPNPPSSAYEWHISTDDTNGEHVEDELLTAKNTVIWSRGGLVRKSYNFDVEKESITQALFAHFPAPEDNKRRANDSPKLEKALVVILQTQARIYCLSGTSHVVHIPFPVEFACAAPIGIILQRRPAPANASAVALNVPRVTQSSLVSSHLSAFQASQISTFSIENMGNVRPLRFGMGSTVGHDDQQKPVADSQWPRLMSLKDPVLELGLVVREAEPDPKKGRRKQSKAPSFLHSSEELLHIEQISIVGAESVTLVVTLNRETNSFTVWRLTYLDPFDPFIKKSNKVERRKSHRRSSMQPPLSSGTSTPAHAGGRDSFGAPLPGKRPRKTEKIEKPLDLVMSLEQQDHETNKATRRSSRRVSSMLARADLSASHERHAFGDQSVGAGHGSTRRGESFGANARSSVHGSQIRPSLGSLLEAPFDVGLDEGFHNMGLEDHEIDGLQREVKLAKIHSIDWESHAFHYQAGRSTRKPQPKVFILKAPPFESNHNSVRQLLVGVQDPTDKHLQFMALQLQLKPKSAKSKGPVTGDLGVMHVSLLPGELRVAHNVMDSCKVVDGDESAVLVLSESADGRHELTLQAPWRELTRIPLTMLLVENTKSLQYVARSIDRDVKHLKSEVIDPSNGSIVGIRHSRSRGVVDVVDSQGRLHQLRIQLQPVTPLVRRVLAVCKGALPDGVGERIQAGWFHTMQWLSGRDDNVAHVEWSATVILLLAMYLNLGRTDTTAFTTTRLPVRKRRTVSGSFGPIRESDDWKALEMGETVNSHGCPPWLMNKGWEWALDEDLDDAMSPHGELSPAPKFMSRHITLAKEFLSAAAGESATGPGGYLPTALSRTPESRRKNATDMFLALHLLLEEMKLDITIPETVSPGRVDLRVMLCQIGRWLCWESFWTVHEVGIQEDIDHRHDTDLQVQPPIEEPVKRPDILQWIQGQFTQTEREPYFTPAEMFYLSCGMSETDLKWDLRWNDIFPRTLVFKRFFKSLKRNPSAVDMVEAMDECGMIPSFLDTLPEAVLVPLQDAISQCQPHPPSTWSSSLLHLVKRKDIARILTPDEHKRPPNANLLAPTHAATWDFKLLCSSVEEANALAPEEGEGTERQAVIRALFKDDRRLNEVQELLSTHKARAVHFSAPSDVPESVHLEKQKDFVARVALGTLAIPSGRGLLFYGLRHPILTQRLQISGFNLHCVVKPANVTVAVDKSHFSEDKVSWAFFHQGVAAALAVSPEAKGIDSSWIIFNKTSQELGNRHAGFLLALGLNGHLKGVAKWVAYKYLTPKHTMTSIGLLLGFAASYMGTMDSLITRLLSVHATRMLPRGSAELNLSPLTQTSALLGIGLLYCNSQHRRMSEIMLSEIEHIDVEDEQEPLRSECYRLAAGFALGFINLGKGNDLKGLHDLKVTEKLITLATMTKSVEIVHILDRAAAGAVMAIAFIYMKTEDASVARKIDVPDSILQFDYIRPDILLLRTMTKNIIMWSKIQPTFSWISKSLPSVYRSRHRLQSTNGLRSTDLPLFSILAGVCLSIALRFSGSASIKVRDLLLHYLDQFIRITRIPSSVTDPELSPPYDEELTRSNARMCQDVLALSLSIVMAGTGDIPVLRRLRSLHGRADAETPYGSHLAAHLAIGALFLGCGTVTFGNSNQAIAALLISFYPIFPTDVMDNRSHLQALRHFWVLATEQRCLVAKDILTGQPVAVDVQIRLKSRHVESSLYRTTPCLLPPLEQIESLSTNGGPEFWDITVDFNRAEVREDFAKTQSIYLRRRPPHEGAFSSTLRALGTAKKGNTPLEWLFSLDALKEITHAERAAMLQATSGEEEEERETGCAVDARLELNRGISEATDRERMEGARLLFEWGSVRDRMLKGVDVGDSMSTEKNESMRTQAGRGDEGTWWMRDSVVEALKGQVMLTGRELDD
ncbi:negative regulator of mitosis [Emericellopsis atlantica]|uniref:Negative regulator of mitosis n=1 Tax=Emericellopsis atlantica TaxID=2614577 RepID=A0A9P7ZFI1_9HYPO|nr:negative regulator of mitosis [Emericellopsis atlantica]KAG9251035.1 negative regulator of mitosis [Emericellopsis atlantica]